MDPLPQKIISDLGGLKMWVVGTIASPGDFRRAYIALQQGFTSQVIDSWLMACETLAVASMQKTFNARRHRYLDREDLLQHGRMAAVRVMNGIADGEVTISGEPIRYGWRSIKHEIHSAAFGRSRSCECRIGGICQFACDCRERFEINCDCSCRCKCHKSTVTDFTSYYGGGDYDPIDRLAGEGVAFWERVEDIHYRCQTQMERDVLNGIAQAIEDDKAPNTVYLALDYTQQEIMESWKAIASHYLKVLVERGEALPGRRNGNQRRPPRRPIPRLAA